MRLEKKSPCKVNLLLNILGRRADGFHELETVMQPVNLCDELTFERAGSGLQLSCSDPDLPTDASNLVHRAATSFLHAANIRGRRPDPSGEKNLRWPPALAAAAAMPPPPCSALNELFGSPLPPERLHELAAALGSDIPFFLQTKPALATGRGEKIQSLEPFPALCGKAFLSRASRLWHFHAVGLSKSRTLSRRRLNGQAGRRGGFDCQTSGK